MAILWNHAGPILFQFFALVIAHGIQVLEKNYMAFQNIKNYYFRQRLKLSAFRRFFVRIKKQRAFSPRILTIEITWNCNLNCPMCPRQVFTVGRNRNMTLQEFKKILYATPKVKQVNFCGLGEPLMNPHFYKMLEFAHQRYIGVVFVTNGTLFTEENIKKFPPNVQTIYFSIDSPIPQIYKKIRGVDLESVIVNIKKLKILRPDIKIYLQPLLMKDTIDGMEQIVYLAKNLSADVSLIYPIAFQKHEDKNQVYYLSNLKIYLNNIKTIAQKTGVRIHTRPSHPTKKNCFDPWISPTISISGNVYPCCYIYEARSDEGNIDSFKEYYKGEFIHVPLGQYRLGNIFKDDFNTIWRGSKFRMLRKVILESQYPKSLSQEEFLQLRRKINLEYPFAYCKVCLFRWGCAC